MPLIDTYPFFKNQKISLLDIIKIHNTPIVLYNAKELIFRASILKNSLNSLIAYSVKANPNPYLINTFINQGLLVEVASEGELYHVITLGVPNNRIVLGGPLKKLEAIKIALENDILFFNVESETDLLNIKVLAKETNKNTKVLLRVNPSFSNKISVLKMGGVSSQFGIDEENLDKIIEFCQDSIEFYGLFMYTGSQFFDTQEIINNTKYLIDLAKRIEKKCNKSIKALDFGGGFGVPESSLQQEIDLNYLKIGLHALFEEYSDFINNLEYKFFESGRFLTATSAILITKVLDVKYSRGKRYIIIDSGINNLGIKQFPYRTYEPFISVLNKNDNYSPAIIVGPTCTPIDIVYKELNMPKVKVNDIIIIHNVGAYSISYSPINFCGFPVPIEIVIDGSGKEILTRKRGDISTACGTGFITNWDLL